jgi:phosphoglucosamine mutase
MTKTLFGTDGVRGLYKQHGVPGEICPPTFYGLAAACAEFSGADTVVLGRDTRVSGGDLADAAMRGAYDQGLKVYDLGIAPTPVIGASVERLSSEEGAFGISITASHNPEEYNGFKFLWPKGLKPSEAEARVIEGMFWDMPGSSRSKQNGKYFDVVSIPYLTETIDKLKSVFGKRPLAGKIIALDTANGAAANYTPLIFKALGAKVIHIDKPSGKINDGCGANDLALATRFIEQYSEASDKDFLGVLANDGDGDRVMGVCKVDGKIVKITGNHIMYYLAQGQPGIVGTDYTNSGLVKKLREENIAFEYCENGDSNVTEALIIKQQEGRQWTRGGEFTGHLIDTDHLMSGDGVYMAAWFACKVASLDETFANVYKELPLWHEKMQNIKLVPGIEIANDPETISFINETAKSVAGVVRIHTRGSGTEPVYRIWAESPVKRKLNETVSKLSAFITSRVGVLSQK